MIDEYCPDCEKEVKLKQSFERQKCPECGAPLLPCSMCDHDEADCSKCLSEEEK